MCAREVGKNPISVPQVADRLRGSVVDSQFFSSFRARSSLDPKKNEEKTRLPLLPTAPAESDIRLPLLPTAHGDIDKLQPSRKLEEIRSSCPVPAGDATQRSQQVEDCPGSSHLVPTSLPPLSIHIPSRQNNERGRTYITEDVATLLKTFSRRAHYAPHCGTNPKDVVESNGTTSSEKCTRLISFGSECETSSISSPQSAKPQARRKNSGAITYAPHVFSQVHHKELEDKYNILEWIAECSACAVCIVENKDTGKEYACKCIEKVDHEKRTLLKEIEIHKKLNHPNIVKLYETLETGNKLFLIMELCHGGDLFERIRTRGVLNEQDARLVMRQVLGALAYCHANQVIHCDVKPENLLLESQEPQCHRLKLTDFGISKAIRSAKSGSTPSTRKWPSFCEADHEGEGSLLYMAPEVLMGYDDSPSKRCNAAKCDLWSAGALLYVLLSDCHPYATPEQVCRGWPVEFAGECWQNISEEVKDLIQKLMNHDIDLRLTAQQALEHEWFHSESACEVAGSLVHKSDELAHILLASLQAWGAKPAFLRWTIVAMARQLSDDCEARRMADLAYWMFSDTSNTLTCERLVDSLERARVENAIVSPSYSAKKRFKNRIKGARRIFRSAFSSFPRSEPQSSGQANSSIHEELKSLVSTVDAENNGIVDYTLLVAAMLPRKFYCDEDRIVEAFKLFDIRGCGEIRPQDLRAALKCRDFPGRFSQMVHDCDLDGDGCINLADFSAMVREDSCKSKC